MHQVMWECVGWGEVCRGTVLCHASSPHESCLQYFSVCTLLVPKQMLKVPKYFSYFLNMQFLPYLAKIRHLQQLPFEAFVAPGEAWGLLYSQCIYLPLL